MVIYTVKFEYKAMDTTFYFSNMPSRENVLAALDERTNGLTTNYGYVYDAFKKATKMYNWETSYLHTPICLYLNESSYDSVDIVIDTVNVMDVPCMSALLNNQGE